METYKIIKHLRRLLEDQEISTWKCKRCKWVDQCHQFTVCAICNHAYCEKYCLKQQSNLIKFSNENYRYECKYCRD